MFNFTPGTIPNNVFVIGGGGTGGRLIPMLSQFMRSITRGVSPTGWLESPKIWLIDDDVVEQKNILRQNFIDRDVGKHKAVVLAERYTKAYGVEIIPLTMRITTAGASEFHTAVDDHLFIKNNHRNVNFRGIIGTSIVVICVDSVQARRDILNTFILGNGSTTPKTFFVDAGNEDSFGQVTCFTPTIISKYLSTNKDRDERELPKLCPVSVDIDYLPMDVEYYRTLMDTPAQGSCADLNQTLAINAIMATTIMGILQNYFYRKPMSFCELKFALNGGNSTTYNTFNTFNNKGVDGSTYTFDQYFDQKVFTHEKDGTRTLLKFARFCEPKSGSDLRSSLIAKIIEERAEVERQIAKAKREAEEVAKAIAIKEIAIRKRAEIKALLQLNKDTAAAKVEGVELIAPAPIVSEVAAMTPPPLVATPRVRRNRNMVELEVPSAWVEVTEDNSTMDF